MIHCQPNLQHHYNYTQSIQNDWIRIYLYVFFILLQKLNFRVNILDRNCCGDNFFFKTPTTTTVKNNNNNIRVNSMCAYNCWWWWQGADKNVHNTKTISNLTWQICIYIYVYVCVLWTQNFTHKHYTCVKMYIRIIQDAYW